MCSVTSQGSPHGQFRRALDRGNALQARAAGAELGEIPLRDALELLPLIARKEPRLYGRACLHWHGRYTREVRDVTPTEAQTVLALPLSARPAREDGRTSLAQLLDGPYTRQAPSILIRRAESPYERAVAP